jgi:hypothetical protein
MVYQVWHDNVNASIVVVSAESPQEAVAKARRKLARIHPEPTFVRNADTGETQDCRDW